MSSNSDTGEKPTDGTYGQLNSTDDDFPSVDTLHDGEDGDGTLGDWDEIGRKVPKGGDTDQTTFVEFHNGADNYRMKVWVVPRDVQFGQCVEYRITLRQRDKHVDDDKFRHQIELPRILWHGTKSGVTDDIDGVVKELQLRFSSGEGNNSQYDDPHIPIGPSTVDGETNQWNLPKGPEADGTDDHWKHTSSNSSADLDSYSFAYRLKNVTSGYLIELLTPPEQDPEENNGSWLVRASEHDRVENGPFTELSQRHWVSEATISGDFNTIVEDLMEEYSDQRLTPPEMPR